MKGSTMSKTAREKTGELFDLYERRFHRLAADLPKREPWTETGRREIAEVVSRCLGIREEWIPEISVRQSMVLDRKLFSVEFLAAESWPGAVATAHLYIPKNQGRGKKPLVLLCCGHGEGGKLCPGYQLMAGRLAQAGAFVLVMDNVGQGEREPMGHRDCAPVFACGLSVQGLIVMETLAWLEWAKKDARFDSSRLAAIGNSGGGTLTMFLAARSSGLAAMVSSGHPSNYHYIASKEKRHCDCNILPGIVGALEMFQLYGCFAPKPLLLMQGALDNLFTFDGFYAVCRKTAECYAGAGAEDSFYWRLTEGGHSWDDYRREIINRFLAGHLRLEDAPLPLREAPVLSADEGRCLNEWPAQALTANEIAMNLSGIKADLKAELWDVFPPPLGEKEIADLGLRGNTRRIFAQYEAFFFRQAVSTAPRK
jgi:dienelactone hydrolase